MNYLKRLITYLLPYKKYALLNILFSILYAIFSGLSFFLLIPLLQIIFNKKNVIIKEPVWEGFSSSVNYFKELITHKAFLLSEKSGNNILFYVIVLIIIVFMLKNLFSYLANYNIVILRESTLKDIRNVFYKKILELPISFYSEKRKGDVLARISQDISLMRGTYLAILELIIREPLTIIVSLFIMFSTSAKLSMFIICFIPFAGFIISIIGKKIKSQSYKVQKESGLFLSLLEETLSGLKIIKGFNGFNIFKSKFEKSTYNIYKFSCKLQHRNNLSSPVSEFLGISVFAVILWYGGNLVLIYKTLKGEEFIGFLGLVYNIFTPAKSLSKAMYQLKTGNAAAKRVFEIIDSKSTILETDKSIDKNNFNDFINFNNISFKYTNEYVINNLSFNIQKGKIIALVGQSGSGKSTIANLITRFYDIQKGSITIDDINIKNITKKSLRNLIGLVTQEAILFNDTIKNNLLLGKPNASKNDIINALKIANAWEFIKDLPKGIDTIIGENGNNLSGGQRQRISIARAVIKNPPIMVLDEATSALDTKSEKQVQIALENMMKNRTSIIIAHRLSTVQNADVILVIEKGKIIEKGNHNSLIKKQGNYKKLVELQQL